MRGYYETGSGMPWYCFKHGHHASQFCPQCQEAETTDIRKATVEEQLRFKIEALETALRSASESERALKRAHELLVSYNNTAQHSGFKCCQCVEVVKNYSRRALGVPQVEIPSPLEKLRTLLDEISANGEWRTPVIIGGLTDVAMTFDKMEVDDTGTMEEIQTTEPFYSGVTRRFFGPTKARTATERPRIEQFDLFEDWQQALRVWESQPPEDE